MTDTIKQDYEHTKLMFDTLIYGGLTSESAREFLVKFTKCNKIDVYQIEACYIEHEVYIV